MFSEYGKVSRNGSRCESMVRTVVFGRVVMGIHSYCEPTFSVGGR